MSSLVASQPDTVVTHTVRVDETQTLFVVEPGESLLEAGLRAGVPMPHECQFGGCGTCRVKLVSGAVSYEEFPMGITEEEAAAGYALACQARPEGDLVVSIAPGEPCAEPERHSATVAGVKNLADDVIHLELAFDAPVPAYRPGQYLKLTTADGSTRSFSMASPPSGCGRKVDLHVRRIPGGRFTDGQLAALTPGARLEVDLPHGTFYYRPRDYRPILMVATGTGLAPIKSMLEALAGDDDCPPVALYRGGRTRADLYLDADVAALAGRFCEFEYVPVLSRADAAWTGRRGYVQEAVAEDFPDLSEHAIYLCGSPLMIRDARKRFEALGASQAHIYTDSFTFQSD